jgi:hypothetical protein
LFLRNEQNRIACLTVTPEGEVTFLLTLGEVACENITELRQITANNTHNVTETSVLVAGWDGPLRSARPVTMVSVQASTDRYLTFGRLCGFHGALTGFVHPTGAMGTVSMGDDNGG